MRVLILLAAFAIASASPDSSALASEQTSTVEPMPVRVGGDIPPPQKIKDVRPVYPAEAQRMQTQGVVIIEATIGADGKVRDAVVRRSIPALDAAALEAVRQWEYAPTTVNGQAVPVIFSTTVNFTLGSALRPALVGSPSAAALAQARDLFREARDAIDVVNPSPEPLGLVGDARSSTQAMLLIELAKSEAVALSDEAAVDAARVFALSRTMPGQVSDVDQPPTQDPVRRRNALGLMLKTQLQLDAIKVLAYAGQLERALQLARDGAANRADLFDAILRVVPDDQILPLAAECRATDGSYPYIAVGDRARRTPNESVRRSLLETAYATVGGETTFKQRAMALSLVSRTYDLVSPDLAFATLADLMRQMIARPARNPAGTAVDRDLFGPEILAVMTAIDPQQAASVAADHPDWDAARKVPGKTSLNPVGGPGPGVLLRNAVPPPPPPPRPSAAPLAPMTAAEYEQALAAARAMPPGDARRVSNLMALAYLLLTNSPR